MATPVHLFLNIPPNPKRLVLLRIGPDAHHIPIQVFDLHLDGPLKIVRWVPHLRPGLLELPMQLPDILHANPYPHPRLALIVIGQHDGTIAPLHAGKPLPRLPLQFKAQRVHLIGDARLHVFHPKHRHRRPKPIH